MDLSGFNGKNTYPTRPCATYGCKGLARKSPLCKSCSNKIAREKYESRKVASSGRPNTLISQLQHAKECLDLCTSLQMRLYWRKVIAKMEARTNEQHLGQRSAS